jgi:leader peptidase (prepilin peptidase) / N-methyltransferase
MPVIIPVFFCVLFGLAFGSFLNVCITRLPRGESVVVPRSHCRHCGLAIQSQDNIPILSWVLLRGRCRQCKAPFSWRYPAVEIVTSVFFVMCYLKFGPNWHAAAWAVFCFFLAGLGTMDAETMLLPDCFTWPGLILGVGYTAAREGLKDGSFSFRSSLDGAGRSLLYALLAAAFLLLIQAAYWMVRKRWGMGLGDIKLLGMIAAWLGLAQTTLAFFLAVVAGAAYGLFLVMTHAPKRNVAAGQLRLPFGTFLSLAGLYSLFLGERTLRWYMQFFR